MTMDLRKLDTLAAAENGMTFTVVDELGVETDIEISVLGAGCRKYKDARAKLDARREAAKKRGKMISAEEDDNLWCELLAKCTTGWSNVELNGKPIEFSNDNAINLYIDFPLVRNQVMTQVHNVATMLGNLNAAGETGARASSHFGKAAETEA
ncbi:MAG: hypothetical protein KBE25_00670 [Laribacter sp.]|nr:hypothetical protein [Laribacter sp.]